MSDRQSDNLNIRGPEIRAMLGHLWRRSRGSLSLLLVWVCLAAFVVVALLDVTGIVMRDQTLAFLGLSYVGVFEKLWLHQFLTAPLLHSGISHLLFNMLSLWVLGPEVERALGVRRYATFTVLCALASLAAFLLASWGGAAVAIGYSGVIFGILVAQAMLFPDKMLLMFFFFPMKMKYVAVILGATELYLTLSPEGAGVAHAAHLAGAAAAFTYLEAIRRTQRRRTVANNRPQRKRPLRRPHAARSDIPTEL